MTTTRELRPTEFPWFSTSGGPTPLAGTLSMGRVEGPTAWLTGMTASAWQEDSQSIAGTGKVETQRQTAYEKVAAILASDEMPWVVAHATEWVAQGAGPVTVPVQGAHTAPRWVIPVEAMHVQGCDVEVQAVAVPAAGEDAAASGLEWTAWQRVNRLAPAKSATPGSWITRLVEAALSYSREAAARGRDLAYVTVVAPDLAHADRSRPEWHRLLDAIPTLVVPAPPGTPADYLGWGALLAPQVRIERQRGRLCAFAGSYVFLEPYVLRADEDVAVSEDVAAHAAVLYDKIAADALALGGAVHSVVRTVEYARPELLPRYDAVYAARDRAFAAPYPAAAGVLAALPPGETMFVEVMLRQVETGE